MATYTRSFQFSVVCMVTSLHSQAARRVYAAYGGVYISIALVWLWAVDSIRPIVTDWVGVSIYLIGVTIIMIGARNS